MIHLRYLLYPFSLCYRGIIQLRNRLYEKGQLTSFLPEVPTISIGNISVGGTGKTPIAEFVLAYYAEKGIRVAYLSRGYGRKTKGYILVKPQAGNSSKYGDEALQVARKFPQITVAVCEDRWTGIQHLTEEEQAEFIVLDDAFQHRRVQRHLDIIVIDANRLPTKDAMLPAGRLREPLSSLKRADLMIVNKLKDTAEIPAIRDQISISGIPLVFARPSLGNVMPFFPEHAHTIPKLKELSVILFSGLGNNTYFRHQIEEQGAQVLQHFDFRDHHPYQKEEMQQITEQQVSLSQRFGQVWILCTEKDYARLLGEPWLAEFSHLPLGYVPIQMEWLAGEAQLREKLDQWG